MLIFEEALKDPKEALDLFFKDGMIVLKTGDDVTDDMLVDFCGHWGGLCLQAQKFWYNNNQYVAELSETAMFGNSELGWHKDSSNTKPDFPGTLLYNKSTSDKIVSTHFVGTTQYDKGDKYESFYHTWGSDHTLLHDQEDRIVEILNRGGPHAEKLKKRLNWDTKLVEVHPVKRKFKDVHPVTGETVYYCSPATMMGNQKVIDQIAEEFIEQNVNIEHKWEKNQIVVFDNYKFFHKRYETASGRCLLRCNFNYEKHLK